MLQDLFTRGIDTTTGKLRPSFQDAPELYKESKLGWIPKEWEVDNFEGASELITDFTANGSFESLRLNVKYYYTIEYARLIRLTDLRVNLDNDGVFVDKEGYEFLSKSTLYENDIMLANVGEYTGFACLMPKVNYPATIAPNMFLIRCNKTIFNSIFMYYFMTLDAFTRQVDNVSASSATKLLNKTNFRTLSIHKPSVIEQEKIGNFLKAIDQKLKTEQDFLHKQQQIKAGLMNDLLSGKKLVAMQEESLTQTEN
jgi:type I restriction enzyme S subunit